MIKVNTEKRYSNSYIGSAYVDDSTFNKSLAEAKSIYKAMQAKSKKALRLVKRGREPKVKGECSHWIHGTATNRAYDWGGNIVGGINNASRIDFYVYNR